MMNLFKKYSGTGDTVTTVEEVYQPIIIVAQGKRYVYEDIKYIHNEFVPKKYPQSKMHLAKLKNCKRQTNHQPWGERYRPRSNI